MTPPEKDAPADTTADAPQRIAKVMARAGLCSRRDAEKWIAEGRVVIDGEKIDSPARTVTSANTILVDGKPLPVAEQTRLWRYHKPSGLVTTAKDEKGRPTVFDRLPPNLPRVISVGRLDLNSEGLLLLTNDGKLARELELPASGWLRKYRVRVHGRVDAARLAKLVDGLTVDGVRYDSIKAELERQQGSNAWLMVTLKEGKNREIRKVMEHLGYPVNRLLRLSYGPFQLGHLGKGEVEEVSPAMVRDIQGNPHKGAKAKPRKNRPTKPRKRPAGKKATARKPKPKS